MFIREVEPVYQMTKDHIPKDNETPFRCLESENQRQLEKNEIYVLSLYCRRRIIIIIIIIIIIMEVRGGAVG